MHIAGFQKITLLDFPGKVACTVFTAGCNLRCPFCHNASLVTHIDAQASFSQEEILAYLDKRRGMLDGVCITGGEPLLQKDIAAFIRRIKALGLLVKLDTNGTLPEELRAMIDEGLLDYVAVDIKHTPERYAEVVGIENFDVTPIQKTVALLAEGRVPYEFRTTVVREFHDVKDIEQMTRLLDGAPRYFLQTFTDSGDLIGCSSMTAQPREVMQQMMSVAKTHISEVGIRG